MRILTKHLTTWAILASLAFGIVRALPDRETRDSEPPITPRSVVLVPDLPKDSLEERGQYLIDNNPFRLSNEPPTVRYGVTPPPPKTNVTPARPPKPSLLLRGVLGGPPWRAIIEGIPGAPTAVVVREGERVGSLLVKEIRLAAVIVTGVDTAWKLAIRPELR